MTVRLGCVVEGHGEVRALPVLLRRMGALIDPSIQLEVIPPIRRPRSSLINRPDELEHAVELAALKVRPRGGVLVLLDSDDDCPVDLAKELLARALPHGIGLPVAIVLAQREFESWFLVAAESLRGHRGLLDNLEAPKNAHEIRGAKEWLRERMAGNSYSEIIDQPALAALFDIEKARTARSFDKCYREVERIIRS